MSRANMECVSYWFKHGTQLPYRESVLGLSPKCLLDFRSSSVSYQHPKTACQKSQDFLERQRASSCSFGGKLKGKSSCQAMGRRKLGRMGAGSNYLYASGGRRII